MVTTTTDPNGGNSGNGGNGVDAPDDYNTLAYGAGSIGDTIYTSNHRCKDDYGQWVENAGVISTQSDVQALGCNQSTGIPTGNITKLYPQLTGPAAEKPTQTHKWWGSISFLGEMTVGDYDDSAYITPDPISARITNMGVRVGGIPSGLRTTNPGQYYYPIGDHAAEVFDGIAVGNSAYSDLEAFTKDYSEGSVTVMWKSGNTDVMEATFVHGSPYVYVKAYEGNLEVRTLRQDGVGEKGTFPAQSNMLGIWTSVAGATNNFLIVGEGSTSFPDLSDSDDPMTIGTYGVINSAKEMTLVYLPQLTAGSVSSSMIDQFASLARNKVAAVNIDYAVNRSSNEITVTHSYVNDQGTAVDTFAGLHPLHWKNTSQATSAYQIRSARGTIKFAELSEFSYQIPYVGVLPTMPTINGSFDQATLEGLVTEFVNQGSNTWNTSSQGSLYEDTYWSGKNYGKAAELAAIARSIGMQDEANQLINWLKAELSDWFTAEADGELKAKKYFVYDSDWNTLLGFDEAYGSHQRLADHHFHYGYFVRAAAEICRVDLTWCGQDQYGPMIELLIRDYAADKDDPLFPHMRNFDPANGFSWADGQMNFIRGNNNESTSEAATAYGAIILYGMATGNTALTEKGMYLHASTGATFWEYWNNIDGYNNVSADADNFFPGYEHLTTSIIWGDGVDFATWFSGAYAHILGIQGLPSSPLIFHVGIHPEYMEDYVALGLAESSNGKPSGLIDDQWRDLWWNLWSMTDADAAIADYNTVSSYEPEQGESKAHTYHWIHTFKALGHLAMGTGELTSDHPAAIAFDKDGQRTYVIYNFTDQATTVTYSDGHTVNAAPLGFTID
jgi:endoglucanase Acf2